MEIQYPYSEIKTFLYTYYDDNELDGLFFDICGEGTDILGQDLPREKLAQEIVGFCKRRENLPNLLDSMRRTREEQYIQSFPQFQSPLALKGLSLKPAEVEIHQDEVEGVNLPRIQRLGGYLIDEPPPNWIVNELTLEELLANKYGSLIIEASRDRFVDTDRFEKREILTVSSQARVTIEYSPGLSRVNGRNTLQLLTDELPVAGLIIMPLERNSTPPAFLGQSFEHVFLAHLSLFLQTSNLKSSYSSTTRNTNRLRLTAELDQRLENVAVNGTPGQSLSTNQTVIGIRGYARDYLLVLYYVSQATTNQVEIQEQIGLLQDLVGSFKIIKPTDVDAEERQFRVLGDTRYQKYVELNAPSTIWAQFGMLLSQWQELDWTKAESKERFITDLQRIHKAVEAFGIDDEGLTSELEEFRKISRKARRTIESKIKSRIKELSGYLSPADVSDIPTAPGDLPAD